MMLGSILFVIEDDQSDSPQVILKHFHKCPGLPSVVPPVLKCPPGPLCPGMSWDVPRFFQPNRHPRSKWSHTCVPGCPGMSKWSHVSWDVLGCPSSRMCPGMSWDVPRLLQPSRHPRSECNREIFMPTAP